MGRFSWPAWPASGTRGHVDMGTRGEVQVHHPRVVGGYAWIDGTTQILVFLTNPQDSVVPRLM